MIDKRKRKFLLIECDAPKLKAQGLSFSEALVRVASFILQDRLIHLIQTKEKELIPTQFAEAKQKSSNYSVIAIIGHSDSKGIRLGENAPYRWGSVFKLAQTLPPTKAFPNVLSGWKNRSLQHSIQKSAISQGGLRLSSLSKPTRGDDNCRGCIG